MADSAVEAKRTTKSLLFEPEKRLLTRIAARLPRSILPDHLSLLALLAAAWIGVAYVLANQDRDWLWGASAGLVVHWFGDSLDGTLARVRKIERPRYGFYVDHLADAVSTIFIGLGLGLSPYMMLAVGFAIVIAYLLLSINVYLETLVIEQFRLGYGILGPTEVRIFLILLNTIALLVGPIPFTVLHLDATVFDLAGLIVAFAMLGMLIRRLVRNLRALARLEPANITRE